MKNALWSLVLLLGLTLMAGPALAHRNGGGMMGGWGMGDDSGFCDRYGADREEVRAVTDKYADQFAALRQKMDAKHQELRTARDNDATTMGEMKKLRAEATAIRKEYRDLREKVDSELGEKFGTMDDDHGYRRHRGEHHRGGMMEGRHHMMGGRHHHDDGEWGRGYGGCS